MLRLVAYVCVCVCLCLCVHVLMVFMPFRGRHAKPVWKPVERPWGKTGEGALPGGRRTAGDGSQPSEPGPTSPVYYIMRLFAVQ